ncbi:MAG: TIGR04255 family protein [Pirellulales bacterium]
MGQGLPNFDKPPLFEVALAVQFQPLENFKSAHLGLLWERYRDEFPLIEEHCLLEPQFERFGIRRTSTVPFKLEMMDRPPTPRCWFVKENGSQLIQVQRDRFIHNWRKRGEEANYPRYEAIRDLFEKELVEFASFVAEESLGPLEFNQCEITYVNEIEPNSVWCEHSQLNRILTVFSDDSGEQELPKLENANLRVRFLLEGDDGKPIGRLHVNVEPRHRADSGKPIYFMTLTARGAPKTSDVNGLMHFLDYGRQVVVKSFASLTSKEMHGTWEGPHD